MADIHTPSVLDMLEGFVSNGCAIQAEIFQISSELPDAFKDSAKSEFDSVLFDFKYLKPPQNAVCEKKVQSSRHFSELEKKAKKDFMEILEKAFGLFTRIINFQKDVAVFLKDVQAGKFVQTSFDAIVQDDRRQVALIEALYLLTSIFLLADRCFPGVAREKIIVAYCRYKRNFDAVDAEGDMCKFCRRTLYNPGLKQIPQGYPEEFLSRFPLSPDSIRFALRRLISIDIYETLKHYPDPSHRTAALSMQAGYVFILLFHIPTILNDEATIMKPIIERFYADNWVISWAPGFTADLGLEWEKYKAAKGALKHAMPPSKVKKLLQQHWDRVPSLTSEMMRYIKQGKLQADILLQGSSEVFSLLREANVTLRWILLHNYSSAKKLSTEKTYQENITRFLLNLSELEYVIHVQYEQLLETKQERRERVCKSVKDDLKSLSDLQINIPIPSGSNTIQVPNMVATVMKKEGSENQEAHLSYWLQCLQWEVDALSKLPEGEASGKVKSLQRTFEEMGHFCRLESATPFSRKLVQEIRSNLMVIHQLINTRQELVETLNVSGEFSYALKIVQNPSFYKYAQSHTRQEPKDVFKLGCLLKKLKSVLDLPIYRGKKRERIVPESVTKYYESELSEFGKSLFDHIPLCVCEALDHVALSHTKTKKLRRESEEKVEGKTPRVEKTASESVSNILFQEQCEMYGKKANMAARITEFTHEVALVESRMKGIINLSLRKTLEQQIRQHVAKRLAALASQKLHFQFASTSFTFKDINLKGRNMGTGQAFSGSIAGTVEFNERLKSLQDFLFGYLRALECLHDCVEFSGYGLWQQELAHIIAISYKKEYDWMINGKDSKFLLKKPASIDPDAPLTFLGRLAREVIRLTSPVSTHFSVCGCCWLDSQGSEAFGMDTISLIRGSIGSQGLAALDALFATRVIVLLNKLQTLFQELLNQKNTNGQNSVTSFAKELQSCRGLNVPPQGALWYVDAVFSTGTRVWSPILEIMAAIGQSQLLRQYIALELRNACMLEAPASFYRTLQGLLQFLDSNSFLYDSQKSGQFTTMGNIIGNSVLLPTSQPSSSHHNPKSDWESLNQSVVHETGRSEKMEGSENYVPSSSSYGDKNLLEKRYSIDAAPSSASKESSVATAGAQYPDHAYRSEIIEETIYSHGEEVAQSEHNQQANIGQTSYGVTFNMNTLAPSTFGPPSEHTNYSEPPHLLSSKNDGFRSEISEGGPSNRFFVRGGIQGDISSKGFLTDIFGARIRKNASFQKIRSKFGERTDGSQYQTSIFNKTKRSNKKAQGPSSIRTTTTASNISSYWDPSLARYKIGKNICPPSDISVGKHSAQTYNNMASSRQSITGYSIIDLKSFYGFVGSDLSSDLSEKAADFEGDTGIKNALRLLQCTGFLDPMEVRCSNERLSVLLEIPVILFLATISVVQKYEYNKSSGSLMRPLWSTCPDAQSFVTGLVTVLYEYSPSTTDQFLKHMGQYVRAYLKTATGATAQGIAAAGVKVTLPQEVQRTVALISELCAVGNWERERVQRYIPSFLLDIWIIGNKFDYS